MNWWSHMIMSEAAKRLRDERARELEKMFRYDPATNKWGLPQRLTKAPRRK